MEKQHRFISFVIGLLFLIVMQRFASPLPVFRFLLPAFVVYASLATVYNRWYLLKTGNYNFWLIIRPVLLLCSAFGIFLILPSEFSRGLFLISAVAFITFFEIILGNLAENLLLNETLIIAPGLFFTLAAFFQYVPRYGNLYVIAMFLGSSLLARSFYEFIPKPEITKLVSSVVIGLFCSQVFWALTFLPFHFSALGLLLFNVFYFCLIMNYYHLFHVLNFKKIQFHLGLIALCSIVVLLATPWTSIG